MVGGPIIITLPLDFVVLNSVVIADMDVVGSTDDENVSFLVVTAGAGLSEAQIPQLGPPLSLWAISPPWSLYLYGVNSLLCGPFTPIY